MDEKLPHDLIRRYGFTFGAGLVILRQGEASTDLYVVLSGVVAFWERRPGRAEELLGLGGPGAVFGEVGAFGGQPRTATVRTASDVRVLRLPRLVAHDMVQASPEFALRVIEAMAHRLYRTSEVVAA